MKPSRKAHKNRFTASHLSSETTATLPEYVPAPHSQYIYVHRQRKMLDSDMEGLPSDQPPDYPDSAEEADEETDSVSGEGVVLHMPPPPLASLPATPSPRRRGKRMSSSMSPPAPYAIPYHHYTHPHRHHQAPRPYLHHRKYKSAAVPPSYPSPTDVVDPYLDSLLERSVHALEMSNTLLQSSITTRTSLSGLLRTPTSEADDSVWLTDEDGEEKMEKFEKRAKGLTKRIHGHKEKRERWVDDLDKIKRDVDRLFGDEDEGEALDEPDDRWEGSSTGRGRGRPLLRPDDERELGHPGVSCSLPTSSSMPPQQPYYARRPSQLDLTDDSQGPRLTYSSQYRSRLISPAPRAITQFVSVPSLDSESITLPSTLGTRTSSNYSASQSTVCLHSAPVMPQVTDKLPEPTTAAYNMLSSFVHRKPAGTSSTPASFTSPSVLASLIPKMRPRASSSVAATSGAEQPSRGQRRSPIEADRPSESSTRPSSTERRTPRSPLAHRPMTPPTEESGPGSSSSSSESLIAKQTMMCLRKILDEQPLPARSSVSVDIHGKKWKAPAFMPVTPAPAPQASTSNATASVSRLFTKAIHTSSTRPPSPPRHSAMKNGTGSRGLTLGTQQLNQASESTAGSDHIVNGGLATINVAKAQLGMLPEILSAGVAKAFGPKALNESTSASSSGQSTPKRISFAELPEVERPEGRSSLFKEKQARKKQRRKGRRGLFTLPGGSEYRDVEGVSANGALADAWEAGSPPIGGGWWSGWLGVDGGALSGMGAGSGGMYVSRMEDRASRLERPGFGFGDWM